MLFFTCIPVHAASVTLLWDASIDEPYLGYYKLYWRIAGVPQWQSVTEGIGLAHSYVFTTNTSGTYEFYLTSVDTRGLEGVGTPIVSKTITGMPVPSVPTNIRLVP